MKTSTVLPSLLAGLLTLLSAAGQDDASPEQKRFKVEVEAVNVLVSVHDKKTGKFVTDLEIGDFEIREDGKLQTITNFSQQANLPLTIALCVDTSSSVRVKLKFEKEAATDFLYSVMRPSDKALLLEFDTGVTLLHDFTSNPNDLVAEIEQLRGGGGTSLYDAIYLASEQKMLNERGRKTLVILSDGADLTSRYTFEEAFKMAFKAEAAIYAISTTRFGADIDHEGDNALKQLAEGTGGRAYFPYSTSQLTSAFRAINEELRNQYNLAYVPTNSKNDGGFRKIRVKVKRGHLHTFYRKGYFAPG
ncbi:MAG: VWA domain-containing protein [Acidobacteriota bacterium]